MTTCSAGDGRAVASRGWCSAHYRRWQVYGDPMLHIPLKRARNDLGSKRGPQDPRLSDPEKRPCRTCKQIKPLNEFGLLPAGPLGRKYACLSCEAARATRDRARQDLDPELRAKRLDGGRRSFVRRTYGEAGIVAYDRIRRGDPCDVCGRRLEGKRVMAIDHCHDSKRVRGILCKWCNLALGYTDDDPARLRALADYLDKYR